jgi:hypothetical protein
MQHQGILYRWCLAGNAPARHFYWRNPIWNGGELLIVTADNVALLRFVEECGMFQRAGNREIRAPLPARNVRLVGSSVRQRCEAPSGDEPTPALIIAPVFRCLVNT